MPQAHALLSPVQSVKCRPRRYRLPLDLRLLLLHLLLLIIDGRGLCDKENNARCLDEAFSAADACAIDEANRACLQAAGCDMAATPLRLCALPVTDAAASATASHPVALTASEPVPSSSRLENLEWLEAEPGRGMCDGCFIAHLERGENEGKFGLGLMQNTEGWGEVSVSQVVKGSAAARAGISVSDTLVRLGGLVRTQEASLAGDFLPLLRRSTAVQATFFRRPPKNLNLCELLPCRNESTPCYGKADDYLCACSAGTEGRACRESSAQSISTSSSPLRIALVLSGQPRFYASESYVSMRRHLMEPYEAEVFFHCWWSAEDVGKPYSVAPWSGLRKHEALPNFPGNEATASAAPVTIISSAVQVEGDLPSKLVELYRPKAHEFEAPRTKPGGSHNEGFTTPEGVAEGGAITRTVKAVNASSTYLATNLPDILYSVLRAGQLKVHWERAHGFTYDVVVKSRFDAFLSNVPPNLASLASGADIMYVPDATRLRQANVAYWQTDEQAGLLSVKRSTVTMGREDVLQILSSHLHEVVCDMERNQSALIKSAKSTHVVRLLRQHLLNRNLLSLVVDNPSVGMYFGLVRGDELIDGMPKRNGWLSPGDE